MIIFEGYIICDIIGCTGKLPSFFCFTVTLKWFKMEKSKEKIIKNLKKSKKKVFLIKIS